MSSQGDDDSVDHVDPTETGDDGDLFGDDDSAASPEARQVSENELGSDDDGNNNEREGDDMEGVEPEIGTNDREARVIDVTIPRHPLPKSSDGDLHTLRIPKFMSVEATVFDPTKFTPPVTDHHSTTQSADFSANTTANSTIRYRRNEKTGKLEGNAVFSRWSDGSATISIGDNIYELTAKPLAPSSKDVKGYQDVLDSHQYAATPYVDSQLMQIVGHMTNQYTIRPNKEIEDVALEKLQSSLAAATRGRNNKSDMKDGIALISSNQDPELQKKQAEMAEKERTKAQRRREAATARSDQQSGRVRGATGAGLSLDDLEGRSRAFGSRKKRAAPAGPRRARRRADYDTDDDDDAPRGRNKEDEYDMEDDFLVGSDEEQEAGEGEESEEEEDEEEEEEEIPRAKKQKTSNAAPASNNGSDVDAEGEDDEGDAPSATAPSGGGDTAAGRGRNRNIIEEDDDE